MTVLDTNPDTDLMGFPEPPQAAPVTALSPPSTLTRGDAVKFLQRATFGGTVTEVDRLRTIGLTAWFGEQLALGVQETNLSRMQRHPSPTSGYYLHSVLWEGFLSDPAQLRKRCSYALSQIMVVGRNSFSPQTLAVYADVLETHAFGTFRNLLEHVTRSSAMGRWLTYSGNKKADVASGRVPDENFAREVMQLFTVGLWQLDLDGTRLQVGGVDVATYDQADVAGLARVFTGWTTDGDINPMRPQPSNLSSSYESGEKQFLGATIPAGRSITESLADALNVLANHPNVAPFISKQLIQRLVASNPSRDYVRRVASVFLDDGAGVYGNLGAVYRAILTDPEAWTTEPAAAFGKLREPVLRFSTIMRALGITNTEWPWNLNGLSDPATRLGQQPYDSTSVFNYYRPGYTPPSTPIADANLVAPEFQIVDETSVIGWLNFTSDFVRSPYSRMRLDLEGLRTLSTDAAALVDEVAARLVPRPLPSALRTRIVSAVAANLHSTTTTRSLERVVIAVTLVAASTAFLHER